MQRNVNEQRGKKFSWPLFGLSIVLVVSFVIFFIKTFFPQVPSKPATQATECPENFQRYQNQAYSVCYPKKWVVRQEKDITYADGSVSQHIVSFTNTANSAEHINIIPNRGILVSNSSCLFQENMTINSYSVLRLIYHDSTKQGQCGSVVSYISVFETQPSTSLYKKGTVISYVTGQGVSLTPEEYFSIENSLKIYSK